MKFFFIPDQMVDTYSHDDMELSLDKFDGYSIDRAVY